MKNSLKIYLTPLSIIIAGTFVAGGLYFSNEGADVAPVVNTETNKQVAQQPQPEGSTDAVRLVDASDHIKGNPNAVIKIVEYSDFECPFCKRFHDTMNEVMQKESSINSVIFGGVR